MGYLDELKKQADALNSRQRIDEAAFERNALLTDAACKTVFQYWLELSKQLNVLRPPVPTRFSFDTRNALDGVLEALSFDDFRVDARKKRMRNLELYDHVVITCWVRGGRRMSLTKNFPPDMERLEARLAQAGAVVVPDAQRDLNTGKFRESRYDFEADVKVGVRLAPDHEQGRAQFACSNFEGLATLVVEFPAFEVGTGLLDELAKWWLGEPNGFVAAGRIVKVVEPR